MLTPKNLLPSNISNHTKKQAINYRSTPPLKKKKKKTMLKEKKKKREAVLFFFFDSIVNKFSSPLYLNCLKPSFCPPESCINTAKMVKKFGKKKHKRTKAKRKYRKLRPKNWSKPANQWSLEHRRQDFCISATWIVS